MNKKCRFYRGGRAHLACQIAGFPNGEVVYACGLFRPRLGDERVGRGSPPFGVGQFTDVGILGVGARPCALEVPALYLDVVWYGYC